MPHWSIAFSETGKPGFRKPLGKLAFCAPEAMITLAYGDGEVSSRYHDELRYLF